MRERILHQVLLILSWSFGHALFVRFPRARQIRSIKDSCSSSRQLQNLNAILHDTPETKQVLPRPADDTVADARNRKMSSFFAWMKHLDASPKTKIPKNHTGNSTANEEESDDATNSVDMSSTKPMPALVESSPANAKELTNDTSALATVTEDPQAISNATETTENGGNRTIQTPVPVAESILRSIYGKASEMTTSEMAALWNVSQLFPVMPDINLLAFPVPVTASNRSLLANGKKPSQPLTVEDLERILLENGFIRQANSSLLTINQSPTIEGLGQPVSDRSKTQTVSSSSQVAFPQPSVLSYDSLKWGVTAASFLSFTILATSVHPSLWLVGGLVGSLYGFQTGKRLSLEGVVPTSFFPSFLLMFGRRIATTYLQVYDFFKAIFFMYKTGELSYSMWRRYAEVDSRFQIQSKIDAWNAVFVEGKESFDNWERENEVGRKLLAAVRTIWLVEEQSLKRKGLKRRRRRSKYRVIQFIYDCAYLTGRFAANVLRLLSGGGTSQELSEFLRGIRLDISAARLDSIGSRVGAIVAAVATVSITSALFAISPLFVMILAVFLSLIWPTWLSELLDRCRVLAEQTRARGRGEDDKSPPTARKVDPSRYHFYVNRDGNRKYYRVAPSSFSRRQQNTKQREFRFPWQRQIEPERSWFNDMFRSTPR